MPKFSYFQQIVNRTKSTSGRTSSSLPLLNPTQPLFRQWEVHQPLTVKDTASAIEERSWPLTSESTLPSVLESATPASPGLTHLPENIIARNLPDSPTITPMSTPPDSEPLAERAIVSPLTPKVTSTISPLSSSPTELPSQPSLPDSGPSKAPGLDPPQARPTEITPPIWQQPSSLPESKYRETTAKSRRAEEDSAFSSTAPINPPNLDSPQAMPIGIKSPVQHQPASSPVGKQRSEKSERVAVEMIPVPSGIQEPSDISESSLGRQQVKLQPSRVPLSEKSVRPALRPVVPVPASLPHPKSATHLRQSTLESPPVVQSSRSTAMPNVPHQWAEPGDGATKRQENTVHIGSIDVQLVPPSAPPAQPTKPVGKSSLSPLSRGFTSSFGLRQG